MTREKESKSGKGREIFNKQKAIGRYYAELTRRLLEGSFIVKMESQGGKGNPDLRHFAIGNIEVKGGGSGNPWCIWLEQFERNLEELERDGNGESFLYALYMYASRSATGGKIYHLKRETPTMRKLDRFLAKRTRDLCLLDIRVLKAIHEQNMRRAETDAKFKPISWRMRKSELRPALKANRTFLRRGIQRDPKNELQKLGLEEGSFTVRVVPITLRFRGSLVRFTGTFILPPNVQEDVAAFLSVDAKVT